MENILHIKKETEQTGIFEKITAIQIGEEYILKPIVLPDDASNKNLSYKVENSEIARIDSSGKILGIKEGLTVINVTSEDSKIEKKLNVKVIKKIAEEELKFDDSLIIQGNIISGFDDKNMEVEEIKKYINTKYEIKIENDKGQELLDNQKAGTNSKIKIIGENQTVIAEFIILLYGDVTGDGKINSIDLLVLQRHILEIEKIQEIYQKAGNMRKNDKKPTTVDLLLIQRHILGLL